MPPYVSTMILRPVRPASPIGPPVTKRPVGLMCMTGSALRSSRGQAGQDHGLGDVVGDLLGRHVGVVLGADDDGLDPARNAVLVLQGDLGLAVGSEVGQLARLAHLGQAAGHPMGEGDRQRHQLGRLAAGEPEHHALVARAQLVAVDAHRDVRRLLLDADQDAAGLVVEAVVGPGIADAPHGLADDLLEVGVGRRRDLAEDDDQARRGRRLAGDRALGSSRMIASRIASLIWSHILSGWPSVTDSDVNRYSAASRIVVKWTPFVLPAG